MSRNKSYKLFIKGFDVVGRSCDIYLAEKKGLTFAEILPKLEETFVSENLPFELTFVLPNGTKKSFTFYQGEKVDFVSVAHKVAATYLAEKFGAKKEKLKFKSGEKQKPKELLSEIRKKLLSEATKKEIKTFDELKEMADEVGMEAFTTFITELIQRIAADESDELPEVVTYVYSSKNNTKIKAQISIELLTPFIAAGAIFATGFDLDDE